MKDESLARSLMLMCFGAAVVLASTIRVEPLHLPKLHFELLTLPTLPQWNFKLDIQSLLVKPKPNQVFQSKTLTAKKPTTSQPIRLVVDLSDRRAYLYHNQQLQAKYAIAVGQSGWETPTGTFKVLKKQRNPVWRQPITGDAIPTGPQNPLGDRWIGFWSDGHHQIGFHGTNDERLVGKPVSHGCLRMRNRDIRALFEQTKEGMPVIVRK